MKTYTIHIIFNRPQKVFFLLIRMESRRYTTEVLRIETRKAKDLIKEFKLKRTKTEDVTGNIWFE